MSSRTPGLIVKRLAKREQSPEEAGRHGSRSKPAPVNHRHDLRGRLRQEGRGHRATATKPNSLTRSAVSIGSLSLPIQSSDQYRTACLTILEVYRNRSAGTRPNLAFPGSATAGGQLLMMSRTVPPEGIMGRTCSW